jgi:Uma2 family endonuclease
VVDINTRPMSLEEFEGLLDTGDERRLELWPDGTVHEKPEADLTFAHGLLAGGLIRLLEGPQRERGVALAELNVAWSQRPSYRPDVVFYARSRLPDLRAGEGWIAHPHVPPDLVVEVRSPTQTWTSQAAKCTWYVTIGQVPIAWLVDLDELDRSISVFRRGQAGIAVFSAVVDPPDARVLPGTDGVRVADVFAVLKP